MNPKLLALICAIMVFLLEGFAIWKGINGTCLALALVGIAGLGGYGVNEVLQRLKNKKG